MQDHIPDALITAFERQYDSSWNDPKLRNERLAMRYGWAAAMEAKPCLHQIQEPAPATAMDALREAEAALEVAMARILKADPSHSICVTSEAKALVAVRAALAAPAPMLVAQPQLHAALFAARGALQHMKEGGKPTQSLLNEAIAAIDSVAVTQAAPAAVAVPDAVRDAEKLLRAEAARLARIYGSNKWYGFSAEKESYLEHLRAAAALAATPQNHIADAGKMVENVREGAPYDNPAFEKLARELGVWGTAQSAVCAQFWLAATPATVKQSLTTDAALPEPDAAIIDIMRMVASFGEASRKNKAIELREAELFHAIETKLRALLATGGQAQAVEQEPFGYFKAEPFGWTDCGPDDEGAVALYEKPQVLATGGQAQAFQQRVQPWMMACFGPEISADVAERNHRFLEEALELVQACGCTASEAHQLVDYVFGRPVGDKQQEVGGVMVTLAALCLAQGLDMHAAGEVELARIWTKVEAIRAKQAAKPKHSPLPEHAPQAQADARDAGRSDAEIVSQTEALARYLLSWKWGQAPESDDAQMRNSTNHKAQVCWQAACEIQELITDTDVENAVSEVDDAAIAAAKGEQQ